MSVIQRIQERYAKLMAIIIALALIIFVVMLAFENGGRLFRGGNSTSIGRVNGQSIEYADFQKKVDEQENSMQSNPYGGGSGPMLQERAIEGAWNQEVNETLLNSELRKLGIKVGKKEMGDILYGPNAPDDIKKSFTDPQTGQYNGRAAKQNIDQILKMKSGTEKQLKERDQLIAYIDYLENKRLNDKYSSLFANSVNYPRWFIERQNADNSQIAKVSYVREFYSVTNDSTIKISDKEIEDYISKHKKDFKQEESRGIAYVTFSALPSSADTADAKTKILTLKPQFDTIKNTQEFLAAQGVTNFYDGYINDSIIKVPFKDSIFKLSVNGVYGPYLDGGSFTLAKLLGTRQQPDTVKARHILISTQQRDDATAKKLVDSIQKAIAGGANFDTLCLKYSEDPGKNDRATGKFNGGVYDKVTSGGMVPEFNNFIFGKPVGTKDVVKTDYGYHYIEILSQKGNSTAYKIAYLTKPIETSQETENNASNEAALFAGDSRDSKSFDANAEKLKAKGINKSFAADIKPMAFTVPGLGTKRAFVKNIYKASLGEVLEPEKVGDNYVVAIVTEVNEEGTTPVAKARPQIEPLLKNRKAAEKIKQKIGKITTLEAAAAALGGKPIETADSLRMSGAQSAFSARPLASESKVIGAAFNPSNKGKVVAEAIEGSAGVYVVRVDNVMATSLGDANVAEQRKARYQQQKQQEQYNPPTQPLRDAATIKDKRRDFY
ncbi:MAG: SurA N-terminal domain-containing protein [Bacteroidota bacterium]|nr:SurA N-terminal domain-containing protein [Bacteroidota bacterium]